ncbi:MAG: DUF4474 domain-containing protein [Lachnospiraceae bacterium]
MKKSEKCALLENLVKPFGYCYYCNYGFFSSTIDAWQRKAGYTYLYDYMSPRFQMVFDLLPIYFDYNGKTWLIEFWKGQYGINTGAEIGIYHADKIISPTDYKTTMFECASDEEMLPCSFLLYNKDGNYLRITRKHWWLTAFLTGCFSRPSDLCMENTITFPNTEMLSAFINGMRYAGFTTQDYSVCGLSVFFTFCEPQEEKVSLLTRFWCHFSQWKNKWFCKLYLWVTRPFSRTEDRILYLYYYLPFAFRKLLRLHRFDKRRHRRKCCMKKKRMKKEKHNKPAQEKPL